MNVNVRVCESSNTGVLGKQAFDEFVERGELFLVDEIKLLDEEDEVLERRVEVSLFAELDYLLEVLMVNVSVDSEQAFENCFRYGREVLRKRHSWNMNNSKQLKGPQVIKTS